MALTTTALVLAAMLVPAIAAPQSARFSERLDVTASRLPDQATGRHVVVLTRKEIARLPVTTLADLLALVAGGGVSRRGPLGIQTDLNLRGATFEEVAVLINGVRVNDPQTGHFHLDTAVPLAAIERVEILLGPGSAVHGPGAFGGVVAITTGPPPHATARVAAGQHALRDASAVVPVGRGWLAAQRSTSTGYRADTDFAVSRGSAGWRGNAAGFSLQADVMGVAKDYGAWAFYSQAFPDEHERTSAAIGTLVAARDLPVGTLTIRGGLRQHRDDFVLDRQRPDWYRNRHRTRSGLVQTTLEGSRGTFAWSVGAEGERQLIDSSRLGSHGRNRTAGFVEGEWRSGPVTVAGAARADHAAQVGWELSPALTVSYEFAGGTTIGAHRGRSFRLPTFTDLYYISPATVGNPDLRAEHAWTDEISVRVPAARTVWDLVAFRRDGRDLIDYVRGTDGVYRAANQAHVRTDGIEAALTIKGSDALPAIRLSASWLDTRLDVDPALSRYVLAHPRFELAAFATANLPLGVAASAGVRYREPIALPRYTVVDVKLQRPVARGVAVELEADNLFDRTYEELDGIPMPGRWVSVALEWSSNAP